jgi:hypothetical protein
MAITAQTYQTYMVRPMPPVKAHTQQILPIKLTQLLVRGMPWPQDKLVQQTLGQML